MVQKQAVLKKAFFGLKDRTLCSDITTTRIKPLEPCPMCAGAVMNSRLKRLVYGAFDDKNGACSSVVNLFEERFTHIPFVRSRILMEQCGGVLTEFFRELRMSQDDE